MTRYVTHDDIRTIAQKLGAKAYSYIELASFKPLECSDEKAEQLLNKQGEVPALVYETPGGGFLLFHTICDVCSISFDLTEAVLPKEEFDQVNSSKIHERGTVADLKKVVAKTKITPEYLRYLASLIKEEDE